MSNLNIEAASEIPKNLDFVPSENRTFAELFPTIEDIRVVAKRSFHYNIKALSEEEYHEHYGENVVEDVHCTNPLCKKGGVSIISLIKKMVASNQTHLKKDYIPCPGQEDKGYDSRFGRPHRCTNYFGVMIDIIYKEAVGLNENKD